MAEEKFQCLQTKRKKRGDGGKEICLVGDSLKSNSELVEAVKNLNMTPFYYNNVRELEKDQLLASVFVLDEFEGEQFEFLYENSCEIFGPTAVIQYADHCKALPQISRPLYTTSMQDLLICLTGFKKKETVVKLASLIHHMGGWVKKDFSPKITHLVANSTSGEKYKYAVSFGIPIMKEEWIYETWAQRRNKHCSARDEYLIQLKLQPFHSCSISFFGFKEDELLHMQDVTVQNGGNVCQIFDPACSHLVVEEQSRIPQEVRGSSSSKVYFVTSEWFWASIQMDVRAEEALYSYKEVEPMDIDEPSLLPVSSTKLQKKRRIKERIHHLAIGVGSEDSPLSSIENSNLFSPERTLSPDISLGSPPDQPGTPLKPLFDLQSMTARQQVCIELLQTETNYVNILHTIITMFKAPLEEPDQAGGPLLDATEIKIIFGNLPPIYEVHTKLCKDLSMLIRNWKEENSIGDTILKHSPDLMKAYPPFVNFFEKTKETLVHCDQTKPRFHAFLKRCQGKSECGRQSLVELMIRPVQRLPSMILLLKDISKHTNKSNLDNDALQKAIFSLKEVLNHINEDKRKTESQVVMFDIVNDIENCPAHLLSSHRNFIMEADMHELGDSISSRGDAITMFLFTDVLEVCKRRSKVATVKSPGTVVANATVCRNSQKSFKHLELLHLSHIKRVIDIKESEECKNVFALIVRANEDLKERLYKFLLIEERTKSEFLHSVCRNIANTICRPDAENLLIQMEPQQLAIDINDGNSTLSRAMRLASKTKNKLGRALSIKKSTSQGLSRAMSTIISPLRSAKSPSSTLRNLRLGSTVNLSNPSTFTRDKNEQFATPVLKKAKKGGSLGPATSKYL